MKVEYPNLRLSVESTNQYFNEGETKEKGLYSDETFKVVSTTMNATIGYFHLAPYPHCCGIVVSGNMQIMPEFRGRGYAKQIQEIKYDLAKKFGYGTMQATVVSTNAVELAVLFKTGWKVVDQFRNPRTKHDIFVFRKEII